MPIYDYECPGCGWVKEDVLQGFDDPPPMCTGYSYGEGYNQEHAAIPMKKLIGTPSFQLRGKGWPDQDRRTLKERFDKRNRKIEEMSPKQQEQFKRIMDRGGGPRYIP